MFSFQLVSVRNIFVIRYLYFHSSITFIYNSYKFARILHHICQHFPPNTSVFVSVVYRLLLKGEGMLYSGKHGSGKVSFWKFCCFKIEIVFFLSLKIVQLLCVNILYLLCFIVKITLVYTQYVLFSSISVKVTELKDCDC